MMMCGPDQHVGDTADVKLLLFGGEFRRWFFNLLFLPWFDLDIEFANLLIQKEFKFKFVFRF